MISNQSKYGSINGIAGIMDIRVGVDDEILVDDIFGGDDCHNLTYYFFEFEDGWYTLDFESGSGATKSRAVVIDDTPQWVLALYEEDENNPPEFWIRYSNDPIGID